MIKQNILSWRRAVRRYLRVKLTGKIYLNDLFEMSDFEAAWANGHIRIQTHESEPLSIACYTETAVFGRVWNEVTINCRGLIYRSDTYEIVARPFPKFHNHNQSDAPKIRLNEPVHVTDKMDGSLGILYRKASGSWAVATKGSFHSEQAEWATDFFARKYYFGSRDPVTFLFEIIYPSNRIVCNYGDMEDLVLLGAVNITSGKIYGPDEVAREERWYGPRTEVFECKTYADALAMPPREGKEGIVIRTADGRMQKIKQSDYIQLHKIVTGLNARAVWQLMVDGRDINEFIAGIPDEFHEWVREVHASVAEEVDESVGICEREFDHIKKMSVEDAEVFGNPRKAFAMLAKDSPFKGYLFRLYDGQDIRSEVLKNARPAHDWSPTRAAAEEAA